MLAPKPALEIFCASVPEDEESLKRLEIHLASLQQEGLIELWQSRQILPGANKAAATDARLSRASLILLLLSPDFLASGYGSSREMQQVLARHEAGSAR